jgi:hypothetical protein
MLPHRHLTTVVGFVTATGWTARLRLALPALLLGIVPGVLQAAPATRPAAPRAEVPAAPALVAEVETYEADAAPAAARRGPSTRPAGATARGDDVRPDRPVRRPLMGNPGDMRDLDAYLYASTGRAADDPYRLTDPMLYAVPWGHPAPPPYPPPPLPMRSGYGYGGGYYASFEPRLRPFDIASGGTPAPAGPVRVTRILNGPGSLRAAPPTIRPPLPPGTPIPRAAPPSLRPGT